MANRRSIRWLVALAVASACKDDKPADAAPRVEAVRTPAKADEAKTASATTTAAPLAQSTAAATGKAKAEGQLGFDLGKLSELYAIEATPLAGAWGATGTGDLVAMRDDDLLTAWECPHTAATHCVAGLSFAEPVSISSVRLFAAAGPKWNDYRAHPRPKNIRVHTDAGWYDVKLSDGSAHNYVNLTPAVTTKTLAIEVLDVHAGKKKPTIWFGELEAFGTSGPKRPALALDPSRVVVSFETEAWKAEGTSHTIRVAFADELRAEGQKPRRLMRATAIHGQADDRLLVIERRFGADCTTNKGSYLLLDRETRVPFPLGDKGAVPAEVTLRSDGLGALFVRADEPDKGKALVYEEEELRRHLPKAKAGETTKQLAARLAFTDPPVIRGGSQPGAAPTGCAAGTSDDALVQRIGTAIGLTGLRATEATICTIEGGRVIVGTDGAACKPRWYAAVLGAAGEVVAQNIAPEGDADGAHFALVPGVGVVFEGTRAGGATSDLYVLDAAGIRMIVKGGALAVREPLACRPCATAVPEVPATGELPLPDEGGGDEAADEGDAADDGAAAADEAPPTEPTPKPDGDPTDTLPDVDDEPE
jgi:hypothetical protein